MSFFLLLVLLFTYFIANALVQNEARDDLHLFLFTLLVTHYFLQMNYYKKETIVNLYATPYSF